MRFGAGCEPAGPHQTHVRDATRVVNYIFILDVPQTPPPTKARGYKSGRTWRMDKRKKPTLTNHNEHQVMQRRQACGAK